MNEKKANDMIKSLELEVEKLKKENCELRKYKNETFYRLTALDALVVYYDNLSDKEDILIRSPHIPPQEVEALEHQVVELMQRFNIHDVNEWISTHFECTDDFQPLKEVFDKLIASRVYEDYYL